MGKTWFQIGFLIAIAITLFYVSNHFLDGYLRSPGSLAQELKSPEMSLYDYSLSKEPPFKYRLLFTAIINTTYAGLTRGDDPLVFYHTYKFWSLVFYTVSAMTFFWLLSSLGYPKYYPLIGSLIFLALPPMLLAFTLPVHTRDDTLAYSLLFVGLIALIKEKRAAFFVIALVGVLTRETLLLLPLLYLVFVDDNRWMRKILISSLPVLLWLSLRFLFSREGYDVWVGLRWNMANLPQVAGFLLITFNACWLAFLLHLYYYRRDVNEVAGRPVEFFYRSAPFTMLVVLVTTFLGGIFNEIRLLYLASPWMIVLFLDFIDDNRLLLRATFGSGKFWVYVCGIFGLCVLTAVIAHKYQDTLIEKGNWTIPYTKWIIFSMGYIFILLLFLPISFRVFVEKKSSDGAF
jgi:hypothetical protein